MFSLVKILFNAQNAKSAKNPQKTPKKLFSAPFLLCKSLILLIKINIAILPVGY
jgi:hypothetical protein